MGVSEGIDKNLLTLNITANHLFLSLTSKWLNGFFLKPLFYEELLNHKKVDYLFILNFYSVRTTLSEHVGRTCRKEKDNAIINVVVTTIEV